MTLHRMDLPDAPVRVNQSRLNPRTWLWRCMDNPMHRGRGYDSWDEAWGEMEKHRRNVAHPALTPEQEDYVQNVLKPLIDRDDAEELARHREAEEVTC